MGVGISGLLIIKPVGEEKKRVKKITKLLSIARRVLRKQAEIQLVNFVRIYLYKMAEERANVLCLRLPSYILLVNRPKTSLKFLCEHFLIIVVEKNLKVENRLSVVANDGAFKKR